MLRKTTLHTADDIQETSTRSWLNEGNLSTTIKSGTSKDTPVGADSLGLWDSVADAFKRLTVTNLTSYLSTALASYFAPKPTVSIIGPVIADITPSPNYSLFVDLTAMGADRYFELPNAGNVGDTVDLKIIAGNATHELIIRGASTITINGGSAATEWSRVFIDDEKVSFVKTTSTNWEVVMDGRKPCTAVFHRTGSATGGAQAAGDTVLPDWNSLYLDDGNCGDLTNDYFLCRRAGRYAVSGGAAFGSIADQKYGNIQIWKNGVLTSGSVSSGTKIANASARQSSAAASSVIGVSIGSIPAICNTGDYLVYFYETEEATRTLFQTDYAGGGSDVLAYSTQFAVMEIL